jgi:hypothetical protein
VTELPLRRSRYRPRVLRGVGLLFATSLALLLAVPAHASSTAQFGIQDDAWLMYGPGEVADRVATLDKLGAGIVRFTLRWDQVAPTKPARPLDPNDPAYRWNLFGEVLDELHARGVPVLVTLYGSPRWANGGGGPNVFPTDGFGEFAGAAARRFPWVHLWTAWNEPNTRVFSNPVSPADYVRRVLNPAYTALHAASRLNRVAGGVTSPRKAPSGMAPLDFMRGMNAARAKLDAYAQNPYPLSRGETPERDSCSNCGYFTMARLKEIRGYVTRYFGAKPIWLTEYGYQTNPPDRLLGVSEQLQARYIGEAAFRVYRQAGVTMLIQFLLRDEPNVGGWQSGLLSIGGAAKLAYNAFALPLAQVARSGSRVSLWGQVRPGSGRRAYVLQRAVGRSWRTIGGRVRTNARGTFTRTLTLPRGSRVRVVSVGWTSPPLTLS